MEKKQLFGILGVILVAVVIFVCYWFLGRNQFNKMNVESENELESFYQEENDMNQEMMGEENEMMGDNGMMGDDGMMGEEMMAEDTMESFANSGVIDPSQQEINKMQTSQNYPPELKGDFGQGMQTQLSQSESKNVKELRNASCFPKEMLSPEELKPQDEATQWAQVNPSGSGSLKGRNFLQAGHNIGINTVGQTLRNANLQLRSEPANPQLKVSPWLQTTIDPDVNRKPFEIGGCA